MFHRHKHTAPAAATVPVAPVVMTTAAVPFIVPVAPAPPGPIIAVPLAATVLQAQTLPSGGGLLNKVKEVLPDPSKIANAAKSTAQSVASSSDTKAPIEATLTPVNPPLTMTPLAEYLPAQTRMGTEMPVNFVKEERPAVVKERILQMEEECIQPFIHREVEKREIHEILQPIHERQVLAPTFEEKELQAEFRPVIGGYAPRQVATFVPSVEYATKERTQIVRPPIIEETIRKTIIEEIQPVIHREVVKPHIIRQTQNIYEKILEPEVILKETRPMIECSEQTFTGFQATQAVPVLAPAMANKYAFEIDQKTKLKPLGTFNETNWTQNTYKGYPGAK